MLTRKFKVLETEAADPLVSRRDRLAFLGDRAEALRVDVRSAEEAEARLTDGLESAKADLVAGRQTPDAVAAAVSTLGDHRTVLGAVRDALDAVLREAAELSASIESEERAREAARQRAEAAPDLDRVAALETEFSRRVLDLSVPLRERVEILRRIETTFPMVERPGPLPMDRVAVEVASGWRGPHERVVRERHRELVYWLLGLLEGPVTSASTRDEILRTLDLTVR